MFIYNTLEEVSLKPCFNSIIFLILILSAGESEIIKMYYPGLQSTHRTEVAVNQDTVIKDTMTDQDSSFRSIDEEQADQIRVFVNTTLIIIIIAILILAITVFLIINRIRRTTEE